MAAMELSGPPRSGVVAARAPGERDCDCLAAESISVSARLAAVRNRKKQLLARVRNRALLATRTKRVVQALCVLQGGNPEQAITYASVGSLCDPAGSAELRTWLLSWVGSLTSAEVALWSTPSSGCVAGRAVVSANKYLRELELHGWVTQQNLHKGLAPTDAILMRGLVPGAAGAVEPAAAVPTAAKTTKHARQWLRRWRRRWGVSLARMAVRQWMPDAVTQQKARWSEGHLGAFLAALTSQKVQPGFAGLQKTGPAWRSHFGDRGILVAPKERPLYGRCFSTAALRWPTRSDHYMVVFFLQFPVFSEKKHAGNCSVEVEQCSSCECTS